MHTTDDWHGLYGEGWQGEINPEAFSHPAKYARALIRHIYDHCIVEGWLKPGDTVVDPFGGVALGALDCMRLGCHHIAVELEPRFVALGQANIALWNGRYGGKLPKWGTAMLLQGDSRQLAAIVDRAGVAVSSPPYAESLQHHGAERAKGLEGSQNGIGDYPSSSGQLGAMPATPDGLRIALSSPPYVGSVNQSDGANDAEKRIVRKAANGVDTSKPVNVGGPNSVLRQPQVYGNTHGQLGAMPAGNFAAALSSPPYNPPFSQDHNGRRGGQRGTEPSEAGAFVKYGNTAGQLEGLPMTEADFTAAISSPPFADSDTRPTALGSGKATRADGDGAGRNKGDYEYGRSDGNLGALAASEQGLQAAISSPPYANSEQSRDGDFTLLATDVNPTPRRLDTRSYFPAETDTSGNLGNLPAGGFEAAVSSPPYETSPLNAQRNIQSRKCPNSKAANIAHAERELNYGDTTGQLAQECAADFWSAARAVVEQTYAVLAPGAHAVWVVKAFVRNGALVDFPDQWRQLCEAVGFVTLHEHRAMLVEDRGSQHTIFGDVEHRQIKRASFFRRLAEKRGSPAVDWETVWCMVK